MSKRLLQLIVDVDSNGCTVEVVGERGEITNEFTTMLGAESALGKLGRVIDSEYEAAHGGA